MGLPAEPKCMEAVPAAPAARIPRSQELSAPWQAPGGLAARPWAEAAGFLPSNLYLLPEALGVFLSQGGLVNLRHPLARLVEESWAEPHDRTAGAPIHPGLTLRGHG